MLFHFLLDPDPQHCNKLSSVVNFIFCYWSLGFYVILQVKRKPPQLIFYIQVLQTLSHGFMVNVQPALLSWKKFSIPPSRELFGTWVQILRFLHALLCCFALKPVLGDLELIWKLRLIKLIKLPKNLFLSRVVVPVGSVCLPDP